MPTGIDGNPEGYRQRRVRTRVPISHFFHSGL